jgi:GT2 family glycosyltransferase
MKVVVGIVTRGRAELTKKAVASALMQIPPPDLVWVVEDGLVGDPFAWDQGGPVRITRWRENRGYLAARMMMMAETEAEVYVSLDDDAWFLEPHAMAAAVRVMEEDARVAAVGFEILSPDQPMPAGNHGPKEARLFIGCGHALRLSAVREIGGYEQMPGLYGGEEKDLCLRLMDRGWKIVKLMRSTVWHDKTNVQRDLGWQRESGVLNDLTLICRRCPGGGMVFNVFGNLTNQILFSCQAPAKRLIPTLAGIGRFLLAVPQVLQTRRPVKPETWRRYRSLG